MSVAYRQRMAERVELVGAAEIRAMLGNLSRQRVNVIINRRDFPEPYQSLVMGKVWDKRDVVAWISQNRPDGRGELGD